MSLLTAIHNFVILLLKPHDLLLAKHSRPDKIISSQRQHIKHYFKSIVSEMNQKHNLQDTIIDTIGTPRLKKKQ